LDFRGAASANFRVREKRELIMRVVVARKLVAYLLAVDKSGQPFQVRPAAEVPEQKAAWEEKTLNPAAIYR
jgi:hypothetical protein